MKKLNQLRSTRMFEEFIRHTGLRPAQSKRSQLEHLLLKHVQHRILDKIQKASSKTLGPSTRAKLLRRIQTEYLKRPSPEETYEEWHSKEKEERIEEEPARKRRRKKAPEPLSAFFEEMVEKKLLQEIETEAAENEPETQEIHEQESLQNVSSTDSDTDHHSDSEKEPDDEIDPEAHPDSVYAQRKLSQWESGFDTTRTWARDRFLLQKWGFEVLGSTEDKLKNSLAKQHIHSLRTLLHVSMLRQKWVLAYRAFCLLIRFDRVDIRAIWPLGVEILARRKEELGASGPRMELLKEQQFLEWLALFYPVMPRRYVSAASGPVFRSGSRSHAPVYVITALWELLVEQNYSKLRDTLDELILQPPYASDGVFYFILALCNTAENIHLASRYVNFETNKGFVTETDDIGDLANDMMLMGSKDSLRARILSNISKARSLLEECDKYRFEYPKELIDTEIENTERCLDGLSPLEIALEAPVPLLKTGYTYTNGEMALNTGPHVIPQRYISRFIYKAPKKAAKSWVWSWFEKASGNSEGAVCNVCGATVQRPQSSTKSLIQHLKSHDVTGSSRPWSDGELIVARTSPQTKRFGGIKNGFKRAKEKADLPPQPQNELVELEVIPVAEAQESVQEEPGSSEPKSSEPESSEPEPSEPELSELESSEPEVAEMPEFSEPEVAEELDVLEVLEPIEKVSEENIEVEALPDDFPGEPEQDEAEIPSPSQDTTDVAAPSEEDIHEDPVLSDDHSEADVPSPRFDEFSDPSSSHLPQQQDEMEHESPVPDDEIQIPDTQEVPEETVQIPDTQPADQVEVPTQQALSPEVEIPNTDNSSLEKTTKSPEHSREETQESNQSPKANPPLLDNFQSLEERTPEEFPQGNHTEEKSKLEADIDSLEEGTPEGIPRGNHAEEKSKLEEDIDSLEQNIEPENTVAYVDKPLPQEDVASENLVEEQAMTSEFLPENSPLPEDTIPKTESCSEPEIDPNVPNTTEKYSLPEEDYMSPSVLEAGPDADTQYSKEDTQYSEEKADDFESQLLADLDASVLAENESIRRHGTFSPDTTLNHDANVSLKFHMFASQTPRPWQPSSDSESDSTSIFKPTVSLSSDPAYATYSNGKTQNGTETEVKSEEDADYSLADFRQVPKNESSDDMDLKDEDASEEESGEGQAKQDDSDTEFYSFEEDNTNINNNETELDFDFD